MRRDKISVNCTGSVLSCLNEHKTVKKKNAVFIFTNRTVYGMPILYSVLIHMCITYIVSTTEFTVYMNE